MRNELCILITYEHEGSQIKENKKEVFCKKVSCTRSEHYQAYAAGLLPRFNLEIDPKDYENESKIIEEELIIPQKVIYKGARYNIIRGFDKDESTLSLTVG